MPVAIGGRIDQNQKPFPRTADNGIAFAILRADIDGRFVRQRFACEDGIKLGRVVS